MNNPRKEFISTREKKKKNRYTKQHKTENTEQDRKRNRKIEIAVIATQQIAIQIRIAQHQKILEKDGIICKVFSLQK